MTADFDSSEASQVQELHCLFTGAAPDLYSNVPGCLLRPGHAVCMAPLSLHLLAELSYCAAVSMPGFYLPAPWSPAFQSITCMGQCATWQDCWAGAGTPSPDLHGQCPTHSDLMAVGWLQ